MKGEGTRMVWAQTRMTKKNCDHVDELRGMEGPTASLALEQAVPTTETEVP
jgi:hypothetical protein